MSDEHLLAQLIDGDLHFNNGLVKSMSSWDFSSKGFEYYVVAILGCQSSGKSTLLNLLFNTGFQVMHAEDGRTQTTVGVWLGSAKDASILVLDVEGTDSRERGEDNANVERKTSLFSLAMAQILIINMWAQDIGRYNASNYSLLKTVFELNLHLFQAEKTGKTLLLFVIRDLGKTSLEKLQGVVEGDMKKIWKELEKPDRFVDSEIYELFDIKFTGLAHKEYQEDAFMQQVAALKNRFVDPKDPQYLWNQSYKTDVPADGWPAFSMKVWETIKENKDLNLPSQKELLAVFRCDEIVESTLQRFHNQVEPLTSELEAGNQLPNFATQISSLFQSSLEGYDSLAKRYHKDIAAHKRETLESRLDKELFKLFQLQIHLLSKTTKESFSNKLKEKFSTRDVNKEFYSIVHSTKTEVLKLFETSARNSIPTNFSWSYSNDLTALEDLMTKAIDKERKNQLELLSEHSAEAFRTDFAKKAKDILDAGEDDMWPRLRELFNRVKELHQSKVLDDLQAFNPSEEEKLVKKSELDKHAFSLLFNSLKQKSSFLSSKMEKAFARKFLTDEKGLPKKWTSADDIDKLFTTARNLANKVLDLYAIIRIDPALDGVSVLGKFPHIDESLVVINADERDQIIQQFENQTSEHYHAALKEKESARFFAIGVPLILLLFLALIFLDRLSYLLLFLLVVAAVSAVFVFGLAPEILPRLESSVLLVRQHVEGAVLLAQQQQQRVQQQQQQTNH